MSKLRKQPFERTRERSFPISRSRQLVQYTLTKSSGVRTKTYDRTTTMSWPNLEFMKDIVTPGFEQLKANGKYVLNAMSSGSTLYQESSSGATLRYEDSASVIDWTESGSCIATYFGAPAQLGFVPNIDNLVRLTQTQCLSNVKTSDMMGFVAIAEARKTLAMLLNPLGSLKSLAKHLYDQHVAKKNLRIDWVNGELRRVNGRVFRVRFTKHRGPGRVVSPAKRSVVVPFGETLSGSVLAWNLGFKPLLQDINAILKQIPQAHQVAAQTYRAKSVDGYTTTSTESKKVSVLNATFARKDTSKAERAV
nr:MAG: hypothetical protein [Sanya solspi-like virus 2]